MERFWHVVFVFITLWLCSTCLQFSSGLDNNVVVYACAQSTVSLPWTLTKFRGDSVMNIQWFHEGRSHEIIATMANGVFFASPGYAGRVQKTTDAGILIHHVTTLETGNYSVEVIGSQADGDIITLRHWVYVHVADSLQTTDGHLHLFQQPQPEYSNATGQFHIVLSCGTFTYPTHPPFQVVWSTPADHQVPSTTYKDDSFHLLLPNPPLGGAYSCTVPPSLACLQDHGQGEATVTVDAAGARMMVLEARQSRLEEENARLQREKGDLRSEVTRLTELSKEGVSFHVKMDEDLTVPQDHIIVMTKVIHNQGQAYDNSTGLFTAPFNGTYVFLGSMETPVYNQAAGFSLRVDGVEVDSVWVTTDKQVKAGGVQAVVGLHVGQQVWLQSWPAHDSFFWAQPSSFSGFLLHPSL